MSFFTVYDAMGSGFNMPASSATGWSLANFAPLAIYNTTPSFDGVVTVDSITYNEAIFPVSGSPSLIDSMAIYYSLSGGDSDYYSEGGRPTFEWPCGNDTLSVSDLAYYHGNTLLFSAAGLTLVGPLSDFNNHTYFTADVTHFDDIFEGNAFADTIHGGYGDDKIWGLGGADNLFGDAGNDLLVGGAGNDVLTGGPGKDTLWGAAGTDRFDFNSVTESTPGVRDTIADFYRPSHDRIDLSTIDADITHIGNQAFVFIGGDSFQHYHSLHPSVVGMVRFASGEVQANVNANFTSVEFDVHVNGMASMVAGDFLL